MLEKMNNIGSICLGVGISLMFAHLFDMLSIPYLYVPLIVVGLPLMIIPALKTKKHNSLFCRIGLHNFVHKHWDDEVPYAIL